MRTSQKIHAGTNKRPRVCAVKNTHLKPSCHRAGNNDQAFPTPNATRRVPAQWARTPAHPPQSGGQLPQPPPIPRIGVKRPTRRQNPFRTFIFLVSPSPDPPTVYQGRRSHNFTFYPLVEQTPLTMYSPYLCPFICSDKLRRRWYHIHRVVK